MKYLTCGTQCLVGEQMRAAVRDVATYFPTAIVSGRCRDKVHFTDHLIFCFHCFLLCFLLPAIESPPLFSYLLSLFLILFS
jgi:hypothetical protein